MLSITALRIYPGKTETGLEWVTFENFIIFNYSHLRYMETQTKNETSVNIGVCTFIIRTALNATKTLFSPLKYEKIKRKSQTMYKFIFNKKLWMLFKNRKRIRTQHFLALQINTKQMLKYLTILQNSCIKI